MMTRRALLTAALPALALPLACASAWDWIDAAIARRLRAWRERRRR